MVESSINDIVLAVLNVMVDELRDSGVSVETVEEALRGVDLNTLSPLEALRTE
jgi:hypothetical protein